MVGLGLEELRNLRKVIGKHEVQKSPRETARDPRKWKGIPTHRYSSRSEHPAEEYISVTERGRLGQSVGYSEMSTIPGKQKMGVQRGAGENGYMKSLEAPTRISFVKLKPGLSHRESLQHRTHNMDALKGCWGPEVAMKCTTAFNQPIPTPKGGGTSYGLPGSRTM